MYNCTYTPATIPSINCSADPRGATVNKTLKHVGSFRKYCYYYPAGNFAAHMALSVLLISFTFEGTPKFFSHTDFHILKFHWRLIKLPKILGKMKSFELVNEWFCKRSKVNDNERREQVKLSVIQSLARASVFISYTVCYHVNSLCRSLKSLPDSPTSIIPLRFTEFLYHRQLSNSAIYINSLLYRMKIYYALNRRGGATIA